MLETQLTTLDKIKILGAIGDIEDAIFEVIDVMEHTDDCLLTCNLIYAIEYLQSFNKEIQRRLKQEMRIK